MPRFLSLLMAAALTASCGPSQPTETVDFLVAHPERLKEVQRLCKEERAKAGEELCRRAAEAANRRFFGDRPEQKSQYGNLPSRRRDKVLAVTSSRRSALAHAAFLLPSPQQEVWPFWPESPL